MGQETSIDTKIRKCFKEPVPFVGFGKRINKIVCFDENGSSGSLESVRKACQQGKPIDEARRYFTLTGCLFDREGFENASFLLRLIKQQIWGSKEAGNILFHSRDIRRALGPFNLSGRKQEEFMSALNSGLSLVGCTVFSMTFDLLQYVKYNYDYDPYQVAFDFLLEKIFKRTKSTDKLALIFEARGKKEDKKLLGHASKLLYETGTKTHAKEELQQRIRGVFFNPKSSDANPKNVYPGIEIADLFSYPIHRFACFQKKGRDFEIVEKKIYGYPRVKGKGLLLFPLAFEPIKYEERQKEKK